MTRSNIVIGALYGDEGKGRVVDHLVAKAIEDDDRPLVVRFSGGHQCGHTVAHTDGTKFVFHSLGSGSLYRVPTFIGPGVTFFPHSFLQEKNALYKEGINTWVSIDPMALVTTPYDIAYNRYMEKRLNHGSCGLGVGATVKRGQNGMSFYAADLNNIFIIGFKLREIAKYYHRRLPPGTEQRAAFEKEINELKELGLEKFFDPYVYYNPIGESDEDGFNYGQIETLDKLVNHFFCDTVIFEGNQGVLLDSELGFFPHVTRAKTTPMAALKYLQDSNSNVDKCSISFVTRCYTTRHGNGPLMVSPEDPEDVISNMFGDIGDIPLINNQDETNVTGTYQGMFRTKKFDADLVYYSISMALAEAYNATGYNSTPDLYITCLDHLDDYHRDEFFKELKKLTGKIEFENIYTSYSASGEFKTLSF